MSITKVKYTGSTPGADANDYVLVDTTEFFPVAGMTDYANVKRCRISLTHSDDGSFELYRSDDRGTTWDLINTEAITAVANERSFYDAWVAGLPDWKIVWVNGSSAQDPWGVDTILDTEASPVV